NGYIALNHKSKKIIIAFRGSRYYNDWLINLSIFPVNFIPYLQYHIDNSFNSYNCSCCLVHFGFFQAYGSIVEDIYSTTIELVKTYPDYFIEITGHSLGSSLAILTGLEFKLLGLNPLIITFGGPKSTNHKLSEFINQVFNTDALLNNLFENEILFENGGIIRIIHKGDYVPDLPPT
ncbi:lipase family protein, partial [Ascoidea rubescens DSM 1968]